MSTEIIIPDDVKNLVKDIIAKNKLNPKSNLNYQVGSAVGEGYLSKTLAVDIESDRESLHLFVKYALNRPSTIAFPLDKLYANEIYFYDVIYPAFAKFSSERSVKDCLKVPKCYATSTKNSLALENLRKKGYTLFDKEKLMNDSHIVSVLNAYARYHALSFAYKDQCKEKYEKLAAGVQDVYDDQERKNVGAQQVYRMVQDFLAKLDPVKDEHILRRTGNLADVVRDYTKNVVLKNEYSIIVKGDCWSNNVMFLYEAENKDTPSDVMLVDWQIMRIGTLVFDLSYFFYTIASKQALSKLKFYLKVYHEELSKHIRVLGSNPDILYPYSMLENDWKVHCKYGYSMAFIIIQAMLVSKEKASDAEKIDFESVNGKSPFAMDNDGEYVSRMKILTEHMIENDLL